MITKLDLLCICETWLDDTIQDSEIHVDGFSVVRKDRNRHGGGVLIYVKNGIIFRSISCHQQADVEAVFIVINEKAPVIIGSLYRPPNVPTAYMDSLLDCIEELNLNYDNMILLGDLNCDYFKRDSQNMNIFTFLESAYKMSQLVTAPTRVTINTSTLIDVILSNMPESHILTEILHTSFSDHYMTYTILKCHTTPKHQHKFVTYRDYKEFNPDAFLMDVYKLVQCSATKSSLSDKWDFFKSGFLRISNEHGPVKKRRLKNRFCPWITPQIVKLMYSRDHKHKLARTTNDAANWAEYKRLRNCVTAQIKEAKKNYFKFEFMKTMGKPKKLWNVINRLTNKGNDLSPPHDISPDEFNNHFSKVGTSTTDKLDDVPDRIPWRNPPCLTRFSFTEIEGSAVFDALVKLGSDSSVDVLGFDSKLLSLSSNVIAPLLTEIFNLSIHDAHVLPDWKIARVTPLYKGKGPKEDMNNYRPIAVAGHIVKIFERQIQKQLMYYLISHNYISIDQSAYRPNHSTQTSIIRVTDDCIDNLCDKMLTGLCFLDIKKCFDCINHCILEEKLSYYGIGNNELKWFSSYLLERQQQVVANHKKSGEATLDIGVPQGSVLGPLLFTLYVNDLSQFVSLSSCNLYADDTVIYCAGNDVSDVQVKLQSSITEVSKWYRANRLVLNAEKCNVMTVSSSYVQNDPVLNISLDDHILKQVNVIDYLGVKIDNKISWYPYIRKLCSSLGCCVSKLSRVRNVAPREVLNKIYLSSIQPVIDYAICSWGFTFNYNIDKIQRLQNFAARIVSDNFNYINHRGLDIIKSLKWMNVRQRRNYFTLLLMFKCINGYAPDYLCNNVILACDLQSIYSLRSSHSMNVIVPSGNSSYLKSSFMYNGAVLWNDLPADVKCINDINVFKSTVRNILTA